jgi:PhoH-like ATPase
MKKVFVLDTNVLLHDPDSMTVFGDNLVVIPMPVIEELDGLKRFNDEVGKTARIISRRLDALRARGSIIEGVATEAGGAIKIELAWDTGLADHFIENKADHRILGCALKYHKAGETVIFITKDINLRIKAEALGLKTQDYEKAKVKLEELYTGMRELPADDAVMSAVYTAGKVDAAALAPSGTDPSGLYPNEYLVLRKNKSQSALVKVRKLPSGSLELQLLPSRDVAVWGMKPLNVQQRFALDLLLDERITLVSLIGVAGAGKTLLSLACGLHKVVEEKAFRRLLVSRPVIPMGRDIGYLPGTKEEKLNSWMGAIYDNLDFLVERSGRDVGQGKSQSTQNTINYFFDSGLIEVEALTYLRGRSLPNQYFIIDDAQNLTPHEIKTVISRAGENTKIVLTGDPYQIDNPYLDASSNGLTYLVDRFKGQEIFGHLIFDRSERSRLAALAAELL